MPLIKATLEAQILDLLNGMAAREADPTQSRLDFASELSTIIDTYIKTATVTVTNTGITTCGAGPGTSTGTGTGSLS